MEHAPPIYSVSSLAFQVKIKGKDAGSHQEGRLQNNVT